MTDMKVGLLCGREHSFPPAFLERVNTLGAAPRITADVLALTGTKMGEPSGYRVIVDRISHEVEYFRAHLKHAVLEGAYVINNRSVGRRTTSSSTTPSPARSASRCPGRSSCRRSPIRPTSTSRRSRCTISAT